METIDYYQNAAIFTQVAQLGSFSKAALALSLSKSHISKSVQHLEKQLGTALFHRSTRKVRLTEAGENFYRHCKVGIEQFSFAKDSIQEITGKPRGTLRITLAGVFGENFIAPVAMQMAKKYPELRVELNFNAQIVDLIEENFDIAIRIGSMPDSSLRAVRLGTRREFICCSKEYAANHPPIKVPRDLLDHNCLGGGEPWKFRTRDKSISIPVEGSLVTNNARVLHQATHKGLGLVKLPGSYVFDDIQSGKLVSVLESYCRDKVDIWIVTKQRHDQDIKINKFVEELKSAFTLAYSDSLF